MSESSDQRMTTYEWCLLLILSLFWGGSFFFVGDAVRSLPQLTIVASRVSIGALLLRISAPFTSLVMPRTREAWGALVRMGLSTMSLRSV
jgi:drug/metabolite transporter (DMT)-like permease